MPGPELHLRHIASYAAALLLLLGPLCLSAEPSPAATLAFNAYASSVETRITLQHRSKDLFLAGVETDPPMRQRLRRGEVVLENLTPPDGMGLPGAMLHHWRGTAFTPGATTVDMERLLRDFISYPKHFAPEVVQASVLTQRGDFMQAGMRLRQHHVITVVMDTSYDINFGRLDAAHGYSFSRSTHIAEIASPATSAEHALGPAEEHGFLWRLNTYWSFEERDGGLYIQVETVSLTRSIPRGFGWAVGPYIESIPRESLEFTLRSASNTIPKNDQHNK